MKANFSLDLSTEEVNYDSVEWVVQEKEIIKPHPLHSKEEPVFKWVTIRIFTSLVEARNFLRALRLEHWTNRIPCRIVKLTIEATVPVALVE